MKNESSHLYLETTVDTSKSEIKHLVSEPLR